MSDAAKADSPTLIRIDPGSDSERSSSSETCQGCRELTTRVERLEAALAEQQVVRSISPDASALGTTACYWTCVGVHAAIIFLLYANEALLQFGLMGTIGAVATLVAVQVLSTRPVHIRTARTMLSAGIAVSAAFFGLWIGQDAEVADLMPFLLLMFPPVFASGWMVAKLFVWVGGWRVVPPGSSAQHPRLGIQHLLLCTFLFACYLGVNRLMIDDMDDLLGEDLVSTLIYLCVPMGFSTVVACVLARILLVESAARALWRCVLLGIGTTIGMLAICVLLLALFEFSFDADIVLGLLLYSIPLTIGVFASAGGTFSMMRLANYSFMGRYSQPQPEATAD
ncbi:MAG: hypothetical protein ACR2NZ_11065 [Rubripirellula sp.]